MVIADVGEWPLSATPSHPTQGLKQNSLSNKSKGNKFIPRFLRTKNGKQRPPDQILRQKVLGCLNRITLENFNTCVTPISKQIQQCHAQNITFQDIYHIVLESIIDKASYEPLFAPNYASLCSTLHQQIPNMIIKCQQSSREPENRSKWTCKDGDSDESIAEIGLDPFHLPPSMRNESSHSNIQASFMADFIQQIQAKISFLREKALESPKTIKKNPSFSGFVDKDIHFLLIKSFRFAFALKSFKNVFQKFSHFVDFNPKFFDFFSWGIGFAI